MKRANNILIVDDDAEFRAVMVEVLRDQGCVVYEAENGRHALQVLGVIVPDLIILDLEMPVMNGWLFYEELQKDHDLSIIPIAILSAAARLRPNRRTRVLSKPVDLPNLLGLLDAIDAPEPRPSRPSLPERTSRPSSQ